MSYGPTSDFDLHVQGVFVALRAVFPELELGSPILVLRGVVVPTPTFRTLERYLHSHRFSPLLENGGRGRIRTSEGVPPADLQSAPFGHSGTLPPLFGASGGTRTHNLLITNQPLCRLSYAGPPGGNSTAGSGEFQGPTDRFEILPSHGRILQVVASSFPQMVMYIHRCVDDVSENSFALTDSQLSF